MQARGVRAATHLVDRLIRAVDGDDQDGADRDHAERDPADRDGSGEHRAGDGEGGHRAGDDLVRLWVEVVRLGLDTFGQMLPSALANGAGAATLDVANGGSTGVVRVDAGTEQAGTGQAGTGQAGDEQVGTEVWLHNGSGTSYVDVALHCGDLRASDGTTLPSAAVRFAPGAVDLPARSSRGVVVSVCTEVPPGTYRGVILATGVPDAWLPIEVAVPTPPGG